jgi:hypothetical protein
MSEEFWKEIFYKLGNIESDIKNINKYIEKMDKTLDEATDKHSCLFQRFTLLHGEHVECLEDRANLAKAVLEIQTKHSNDEAVQFSRKQLFAIATSILVGFGSAAFNIIERFIK